MMLPSENYNSLYLSLKKFDSPIAVSSISLTSCSLSVMLQKCFICLRVIAYFNVVNSDHFLAIDVCGDFIRRGMVALRLVGLNNPPVKIKPR